MNKFNVQTKTTKFFNVIVPNFSIFDTVFVEIDYQTYKMLANILIVLNADDTIISCSNNKIVINEIKEIMNLYLENKNNNSIIVDVSPEFKEAIKEVAIKLSNKLTGVLSSKDNLKPTLNQKNKIEIDMIVAELVKLFDVDILTIGDMDDKILQKLYYKTEY